MPLETAVEITENIVLIAVVLILALILRIVLVQIIKRVTRGLLSRDPAADTEDLGIRARRILARASGTNLERHQQRVQTTGSLLRNIVDVVIVAVTVITVLAIVGVPMGPFLASAGVGGLAIGFGAQSLVKDYISGIFMLMEDQFGVGDLVEVGDITGTVLEVNLRITKLRALDGKVFYVRNGEILTVGNISQGYSTAFVQVPVAIDEDAERVMEVLKAGLGAMADEPEWSQVLLENPVVLGVDSLSEGTMAFNIMIKSGPHQQWGPMREVRRRARISLAEAGIRRPILPGEQALETRDGD